MKTFRKQVKKWLPIIALIMVLALILSRVFGPDRTSLKPQGTIFDSEAANYIGKVMEVCGEVVSASYATQVGGQPTFLNFGAPHPNQIFTGIIWGNDRPKWNQLPEVQYLNRRICVTGRIEERNNIPQIQLSTPSQVRFE
jgi:hypothetical protein